MMLKTVCRSEGTESSIIPDGVYGTETTNAVSTFQRNHGLPVTGAVNQATWDSIVSSYNAAQVSESDAYPLYLPMPKESVYAEEDENSNILLMQCMLQEISQVFHCVCPPSISGVMDQPTCTCIEQWQQLCDLPVTGKMDLITWKNLALCYPLAFGCHN